MENRQARKINNDDGMEISEASGLNLHFGFLDTGSWRSQESRLFITGVPKLRNAKRRNPKTSTSTKTSFRSFADREIKDQRNFNL